ncbi:MAG TPA: hypothetical protein VFY87_03850 [Geminicoccaceae bacterium]|nr:hypothetical protein [Geminicoccaceae bacterium]
MLLPFPDPAAPGERVQKESMGARLERGQLQPLLQEPRNLVVRNLSDELLEQRGVKIAEPPPLGGKPSVEGRVPGDLQAVEEVTDEQGSQSPQPLRGEHPDLSDHAGDLDRVDEAVREVEPDGFRPGVDPSPPGLVEKAAELTEAPAELAPRVVGDVPEQVAELAARHGMGRQR